MPKRRICPCRAPAFFLACIALFFASCASRPEIFVPDPEGRLIPDVPFYAQEKDQCGPAALAGVMNFWGADVSPLEVANSIYRESGRGQLDIDMFTYPRSKGFSAERYSGGMDDLKEKISKGFPLIVLVDTGFSVLELSQFMVITGYNLRGVIANSGKKADKFIPEQEFVNAWKKTGYWTLLIKPEH